MNHRCKRKTFFVDTIHLALIMDGNRRWAKQRKKGPLSGHQKGAEVLRHIVEACPRYKVKYLTIYAFSSENWNRSNQEVQSILWLMRRYLKKEVSRLHLEGVAIRFIGQRSNLPQDLLELMESAETLTKQNTHLFLQVAFNYGGRSDIQNALETLGKSLLWHNPAQPITVEEIGRNLWTGGLPDPDILIRTGNEQRLSNFLLWQLAYTELFFSPKYWPDYTEEDLAQVIQEYHLKHRRFGR